MLLLLWVQAWWPDLLFMATEADVLQRLVLETIYSASYFLKTVQKFLVCSVGAASVLHLHPLDVGVDLARLVSVQGQHLRLKTL